MSLFKEINENVSQPKPFYLYLDVDGVFADFERGFKEITGMDSYSFKLKYSSNKLWKVIENQSDLGVGFFENLPKMKNADKLFNFCKKFNPEFLTATGFSREKDVQNQKTKWLTKNYPGVKINFVVTATDKQHFVSNERPCILIDDREKAIDPWRERGGYGILHRSVNDTIKQLQSIVDEINENNDL